jgi:hypothetical protein
MKLKLYRAECGKVSTVGTLTINGVHECFILEDADRLLEKDPEAKVYGKTCIPRGTYKVIITWSNRFKKELPLLVDVPGFEGIRIHPGNTHEHTEGCLLPGTSFAKEGEAHTVQNSRNAFFKLYQKIEEAIDSGDDVEIEVV